MGHTGSKKLFYKGYDELAKDIYSKGPITTGIDALIGQLQSRNVCLGLVSSSPMDWIMKVVGRLTHGDAFQYIESVNEHPNLRPKPAPDGYIAAMKELGVSTTETLIIEDSQTGINAAIASGAHVCCFALHVDGELPHGTDAYVHTIDDLSQACFSFVQTIQTGIPQKNI